MKVLVPPSRVRLKEVFRMLDGGGGPEQRPPIDLGGVSHRSL
jgi:hypothetical protein